MANSFNEDSFTSTSFTTESVVIPEPIGTSGGLALRARRLFFPESRFIKQDEFSKKLIAKPFRILTFTQNINLVPTLTQYKRIDYQLKGYPRKDTEQDFVSFRVNPSKTKAVKIADITAKPKPIEENLILQSLKANPISITLFSKELKARTLHGINIIRKAIAMEGELSFEFKEAASE